MCDWKRAVGPAAILALLSMTACSGGGGDDPAGITASGRVADGYLRGAKVCLDVDGNRRCDSGEPTAWTGAGGTFEMGSELLGGLDPHAYAMVVEVPAEAVDEDTGSAVGQPYVLSAPAGRGSFVSPITTLIHQQMAADPGLTPDGAEQFIRTQLGVSDDRVSLFADYVAGAKQMGPEAMELARVHKVAQVVARIMADMKAQVEAAADEAGYVLTEESYRRAADSVAMKEVMDRLPGIVSVVEQAGGSFNPDSAMSAVMGGSGSFDRARIGEKMHEAAKTQPVAGSVLAVLRSGGLYHVLVDNRSYPPYFNYGALTLGEDGLPTQAEYSYDLDDEDPASEWLPARLHTDYYLTDEGWVEKSDLAQAYSFTFNADGTATKVHAAGHGKRLSIEAVSLAGTPHADYLEYDPQEGDDYLKDEAATFPEGSKAYRFVATYLSDVYKVEKWDGDASIGGHDYNYLDPTAYIDGPEGPFGPTITVKELADIPVVHGYQTGNYIDGINRGASLSLQFDSDGTVYCFARVQELDRLVAAILTKYNLLPERGTWSLPTVQGKPLLMINLPAAYLQTYDLRGQPFFAEFLLPDTGEKVFKYGMRIPAGTRVVEDYRIDPAAYDSLMENIDKAVIGQ